MSSQQDLLPDLRRLFVPWLADAEDLVFPASAPAVVSSPVASVAPLVVVPVTAFTCRIRSAVRPLVGVIGTRLPYDGCDCVGVVVS